MTHAEMFAELDDYWRLVAVLPLNGNINDAYTVWHHSFELSDPNKEITDIYAICDNHGFNFAMAHQFVHALNYCTRNCGWGEITMP